MGFYARARKKVESSVESRGCGHSHQPMCMRRGGRDARARRRMGPWSLDILTSPNLLVPLIASVISHEMHHSCLELACPHLNLKETLSALGHLHSTAKLCGTWAKWPTRVAWFLFYTPAPSDLRLVHSLAALAPSKRPGSKCQPCLLQLWGSPSEKWGCCHVALCACWAHSSGPWWCLFLAPPALGWLVRGWDHACDIHQARGSSCFCFFSAVTPRTLMNAALVIHGAVRT